MEKKLFQKYLQQDGIEVYAISVELISKLHEEGYKIAVVSSNKSCSQMIQLANIVHLFDIQVDRRVAEKLFLQGKPHPDILLYAEKLLGVQSEKAVVVENTLAGVETGVRGHFGLVMGIDRMGHAKDLKGCRRRYSGFGSRGD